MTELSAPGSATAAAVRSFHFPAFDGLRAIAALAVALTHSAFISGFNARNDLVGPYTARLDVGVAVFFVISGFLLYRPFVLSRLRTTGAPATLPYFRRRFLRIYPAFWLVFTIVLFVPVLRGAAHTTPSFEGLVAHYSLTNIYFQDHVLGPVQQTWTQATEIAIYIFMQVLEF
jgi:peptidoglycan/LPS O-acetylase OafA/YrhL